MSGRLLLVCGDYPPVLGGISDYSRLLAAAVARRGWQVTILTSAVAGLSARQEEEGVVVRRVMTGWRMRDLPRLLRAVDEAGAGTVVHIQYPAVAFRRNPMINLLPAVLRGRFPASPVAVTVHDARVMRRRWRARLAPMLSAARVIVHVDEPDREYLDAWRFGGSPLFACIPIGSNIPPVPTAPEDRERWREEFGLPGSDPIVAFFGMLYPHKGLAELVDAVGQLRAAGTRARLLVIGDFDRPTPYEAELAALLAAGLEERWISWQRGASAEEVSRALHAADAAALPFHSGAASNRSSLLTALAHGLPTVTTAGPATPADFGARFAVRLVPPRDSRMLAREIAAALAQDRHPGPAIPEGPIHPGWDEIALRHVELYQWLTHATRVAA